MGRPSKPKHAIQPTEAELAILDVLWTQGPCTVRQVHDALIAAAPPDRRPGYTTVLKLMQIMADKGWATRDESAKSHVYTPTFSRQRVQSRLVDDLVARAFSGSASALVVSALSGGRASAEEIAEIRAMLDRLEREENSR
jgi:BlaI family penicillinase repressor